MGVAAACALVVRRHRPSFVLVLAPALLFAACDRHPTSTASETPTAKAISVAVTSATQPSAAPDARPADGCDFTRGFHGTLGTLEIFARLTRDHDDLVGRYFYGKVGVDLALEGGVAGDRVKLDERSEGKTTGHFEAVCAADGHLRGTWTKAEATADAHDTGLTFDLAPVTARAPLLVAKKHRARSFAPKPAPKGADLGLGFAFEKGARCTDTVSWPEVFGAVSAETERRINAGLEKSEWALTDKDEVAALQACVTGERLTADRDYQIALNEDGVIAVSFAEISKSEGGTHPWDAGPMTELAFDARATGAPEVKRDDLLAKGAAADAALKGLLDRCDAKFAGDMGADAVTDLTSKVTPSNADLLVRPTPLGLHFAAVGYAPPARVLEGEGPTISYAALVSAKVLARDSRVARLWAATKSAGKTDDPCVPEAKH